LRCESIDGGRNYSQPSNINLPAAHATGRGSKFFVEPLSWIGFRLLDSFPAVAFRTFQHEPCCHPFSELAGTKAVGKELMFENLLAGIKDEEPSFDRFPLRDINPVSGHSKTRVIANPNPSMRTVHQRILRILERNWLEFGGLSYDGDLSPWANAARHDRNRYFYQTDLSNAYRSVPLDGLARIIAEACKADLEAVRMVLSRYCFEGEKGLIVGAPASPKLFNIYAQEMLDKPIRKFWPDFDGEKCKFIRKMYTRYLDDLTFSSPDPISDHLRRGIRDIIAAAGFEVNHRKSTLLDLMKGTIIITGVGLAYNPHGKARTFVPRHYLRRMKGMLHLAIKGDTRINRNEIEGLMGVFYSVFGGKYKSARHLVRFNAAETKFLRQYREYRSRYGNRRC
jgi:hypothetical protein